MTTLIAALLVAAAVAVTIAAIVVRITSGRDPARRRAIIAQYEPPPGISVFEGAAILDEQQRVVSAQLIDLAVRRAIKVRAANELELVSSDGLDRVEVATLDAVFTEGRTRVTIDRADGELSERLGWVRHLAKRELMADGLRERPSAATRGGLVTAQGFIVTVAVLFGFASGSLAPTVICAVLFGITAAIQTPREAVLTRAGADVRDHLLGLKLYIGLAEADRLRMLQGPDGALTDGEVFRLTERLLGWAVLFGFEKEWARLLEVYGENAELDGAALDLPILIVLAAAYADWSPSDATGDPSDPDAGTDDGDASNGDDSASADAGAGDGGGGWFDGGGFGGGGFDGGGGDGGGGGGGD